MLLSKDLCQVGGRECLNANSLHFLYSAHVHTASSLMTGITMCQNLKTEHFPVENGINGLTEVF
jgi:hypothetical protein